MFANLLVGCSDRRQQYLLGIFAREATVKGNYGLDRDPAGFLSAFIAAHPVGHHRKTALVRELFVFFGLPVSKRIFVILSLTADVGLRGKLYPGAHFHPDTTWVLVFNCISIGRSSQTIDYKRA